MSTQTDKIRESLHDAKDRIDDMLASVDSGIHESELHDTEGDIDDALAVLSELEAHPPAQTEDLEEKAGELSDFDYRIINERAAQHRMHDHKPGADGCADEFGDGAEWGVRHFVKDHGYLRPSQAIGEPVAWMSDCCNSEMRQEVDNQLGPIGDVCLKCKHYCTPIPLYRSPISTEARDLAIEAGEGTGLMGFDGSELREGDTVELVSGPYKGQRAVIAWNPKGMWSLMWPYGLNPYWIENPERLRKVDQALSALRR